MVVAVTMYIYTCTSSALWAASVSVALFEDRQWQALLQVAIFSLVDYTRAGHVNDAISFHARHKFMLNLYAYSGAVGCIFIHLFFYLLE